MTWFSIIDLNDIDDVFLSFPFSSPDDATAPPSLYTRICLGKKLIHLTHIGQVFSLIVLSANIINDLF